MFYDEENKYTYQSIDAVEMRVVRAMSGGTWIGKLIKSVIRESCGVELVVTKIEKSMLRWFEHVEDKLKKIDETNL